MKYENWLFGKDGALLRASAHGKLALAEELVSTGADVNITSSNGFTPLHRAAQHGHVTVVEFLLSKGAKLKPASKDHDTPLSLAQKNGHEDIAEILRKHKDI